MSSAASHHQKAAAPLPSQPFQGGGRWLFAGGIGGAVLLLVTLLGGLSDPKAMLYSYLVAFAYWCGIALASLILLMIFHATHARWMTVLRRPVEAMATSVPLFILLFIPIAVGMKHLYVWVDPPADLGKEALHLIHHKAAYLNVPFFLGRAGFYLLLATFLGWRLSSWSLREDKGDPSGNFALLGSQRRLSAGGLPFLGLAFTFAAFDWLMSLNPTWFSTIFGVYFFAGSFGGALSLLAILTDLARVKNVFGGHMNIEHTHSIGKLMLAFTCFWTYIAFSQLMLIWIAGLPEEIPFYLVRFTKGWAWVGVFLIFGHFFLPFGALLSRSLKRNPRQLAFVGVWILLVHYIDIYWLVMPTAYPDGFAVHWTDFTAFLGIGLLAIAFGVFRMRGKLPIPVRDPYLPESLRYRQP